MVGRCGARGQHQRAGLGDAGEGVLQADHIGCLGAALAEMQQRARGPRDRLQLGMRRHHDVGRQVLRGEIVRDRVGHRVEVGHAGDAAELLLHVGDEQRDLLRRAAGASAPESDAADASASRPRSIAA